MEMMWSPDLEVGLFHSLHGHKPIGLNKHFHMVCIQHKLQQSCGAALSTDQIWNQLRKLYDLESLDEFEKCPLPSEDNEFFLSDDIVPNKGTDPFFHTSSEAT